MESTETRLDALARVGKALADPTRCRILLELLDHPCYPAEMAAHLGLTRANVSNHLACLRGCGLVVAVQEGRRARYVADRRLAHALSDLVGLALRVNPGQACLDDPADVGVAVAT
jgi:DNA-binding transcriptional ArsR family regulator